MSDEAEITKLLQAFFDEMGEWEAWCTERRKARGPEDRTPEGHARSKAVSIDALQTIFKKYCTSWDEPKRAQGGSIHFSNMPVYGKDLIEILEIELSNDAARVVAKENRKLGNTQVYYLKRTESGWKIEDNRKRIDPKGNEVSYSL